MSFIVPDEERETQDAPSEPGGPPQPVEISDPRALRALAHPARLAILEHLTLDGPATATECAEVAGLSPSACSYHLRALARYGFVHEDPSGGHDRRHRPWRAAPFVAITVGTDPRSPEAVRSAGRLLAESVRARSDDVRAEYLDNESRFPADWQAAAGTNMDVLHVTPAELDLVRTRIYELLSEYRRMEPAQRPPDAQRVHVLIDYTPWFVPGPPPEPVP
jgi:DNA-binding transcriptional ArsR family regulator